MKNIIAFALALALGAAAMFGVPSRTVAAPSDWKALQTGTTQSFSSISCPEPRTCYVVSGLYRIGGTGGIVKTTDGGDSFTALTIPTTAPLYAVSCLSANGCYASGGFGTVLRTTDGGASWSLMSVGARGNLPELMDILALSADRAIAVGKDAVIYRTEDGGAQWNPRSVPTLADFAGVYFGGSSVGYVAGVDGTFMKTSDGGATWTLLHMIPDAREIRRLRGAGGTLIAAGDALYVSIDGGTSWTRQNADPSAPGSIHRSVALSSEKTVYSLVGASSIAKTTDGGRTWGMETTIDGTLLQDITCPLDGYCLAIGGNGKAFRFGTPPSPPPPPPPPPPPAPEPSAATTTAPIVVVAPTPVPAPAPAPAAALAPSSEPAVQTATETVKTAVSAVFSRTLKKGAQGTDVRKLQEILAGVGGVYDGKVTGYFGPATAKAVGKFQEKYNLAEPGGAGYGQAGPKTRAKLIETAKTGVKRGAAVSPEGSPKSVSAPVRTLKKGARGEEVQRLQEMLAKDTEVYPEGEASGYFGPATAKAVKAFQEKHGISGPGEPGYGEVGPKTRAKFRELNL